ncbi:MAG: hypothetical protein FJY29_11285 [Betaproteobacteria bacterium]|nr:hypothetical protein [Betaproteobacteria bacterium]
MKLGISLFTRLFVTLLFLASVAVTFTSEATAYPVVLNSNQVSRLHGIARNQLIALRAHEQSGKRVALQIDEVEDDAALVLREPYETRKLRSSLPHPKRSDPFSGRLQSVHRLVLDDRDFATCNDECVKRLPETVKTVCGTPDSAILLKITLADTQKHAFIADCGMQMSVFPTREIKFDTATQKISTPYYEYSYQSEKNVFFNSIKSTKGTAPILSSSELKAYLKPKYLFNMKFKDDDLVSQITSLSKGSQSLSLEVAVALNILAMKINNQICCDVSFFEDSLYFPVVLDLPFNGDSFAKGSGVFFGFQSDPGSKTQPEFVPATSPEASDAIVIQQQKELVVIGMRNPNRKSAELVRPQVVTVKDMEKLKFMPVRSGTGIFYDIQNAKQGFQHFNVWMYFGAEQDKAKLIDYAQHGPRVSVESVTIR